MKSSPARALAAGCITAAGFLFISAVIAIGLAKANPGGKDFIEYWAAEQGLVRGNPYDFAAILRMQHEAGFEPARPEFWYSPPPAFLLALPLGYLSAKTGLIAWTIFHFACLSISLWLLWRLHGRPDSLLHLCGYLFAPAVICLGAGQISTYFLLGVTLFLTLHQTRPFLAGAALFPCILKPHLFLPFALVLLLWIVSKKAYWIPAGFIATLIAGAAVAMKYDPHIWFHYTRMMKTEGMLNEYIATLSVSLRFLIDRRAVWIQFIPVYIACGWAIWYFWTRRARWSWMDQGLLVLLVSVMCAPYGWFFDESVLLPAVLTGVWRAKTSDRPLWPIALIAGVALIEVFQSVKLMSPYYLWTTPAWLGWYLYATRFNAWGITTQPHPTPPNESEELPKALPNSRVPLA
jgi:Glycosyltransferase family 87